MVNIVKSKKKYLFTAVRHISAFLLIAVVAFSTVLCASFNTSAATGYDDIPYKSYTYQTGYKTKKAVETKPVYEAIKSISGETLGVGSFATVSHIFSKNGNLYILDSDNGRILFLNSNYEITNTVSELNFNGETINFKGAKGLFVSNNGGLYIADTQNARVLFLNSDKQVYNILYCPDSELLDEDFLFSPSRVVKDENGFLYVLSDGCYYGALVFSPENEFLGFYGANTVTTSVFTVIQNLVQSLFDSDEKRSASIKKLPYQFSDICIDERDFILTVSESSIRRLGPSGKNILNYQDNYKSTSAENLIFGDEDKVYSSDNTVVKQSLIGIAVSGNYIYACDSLSGRIYMYDNNCNLISVFGGGMGEGNQLGTFVTASSIAVFGNELLVSDSIKNTVTIFRLTDYGKTLIAANDLTLSGDYAEAKPYWEQVNKIDKNCQLAYSGLAKAALLEDDYSAAMKYSENGVDRVTYSKAFGKAFTAFVTDNFLWIFALVLLIIAGICCFIIYTNKHSIVLIKNRSISLALSTTLHPFSSLNEIKYKKLTNVPFATLLLVLFYIGKAMESLNGGFMYSTDNNEYFNSLLLIIGTVGIVLLGTVVNWAVCILFEGKGRIKEIYCAFCYSLIPQIVYSVLFVILSKFIVPDGTTLITILNTIFIIYTAILLLISICVVHEFDFFKSIATAIVTVLGMILVGFIIFMVLTLCQNFIGFIVSIIREVTLR